mmetsp:Transcript_19849/g.28696  ORF Transcript_19849/g.28696 Transcript_19849/m.28696 type:complete len:81 (+) Transcript_19849:230-472(+)
MGRGLGIVGMVGATGLTVTKEKVGREGKGKIKEERNRTVMEKEGRLEKAEKEASGSVRQVKNRQQMSSFVGQSGGTTTLT